MGIDYTVTLRNAQELAAWEQSAQASAKAEKQLLKNAQQYKGVEVAAKALQQQQKAIAETESQIERERTANSNADVSRLEKKLEMLRRVSAEIQNTAVRESARESQAYTAAFATGTRRGSYSSFPKDDPFQTGLRRMDVEKRIAEETATANQRAFMSGQGGLSGSAVRDPWGEGMAKIHAQNAAAARKASEETMAAHKRMNEEAQRLQTKPIDTYRARFGELSAALKAGGIDQRAFNTLVRDAADDFHKAERAGEKAFGRSAVGKVIEYAAAIATAAAAAKVLYDGLSKANEERSRGAETVKSEFDVISGLAELSGGDQKLMDRRVAAYRSLRADHGLSKETAASLQESAISNQNEKSMRRFAATEGGVGNAAERMRAASRLEFLSKGKVNEIQADAGLLAAAIPSAFKQSDLATFLPTAAESMSRAGTSPTELLGAYSMFSDTFKAPTTGADRLKTLQSKMADDKRLKGKGVHEGVREMMTWTEGRRKGFLKDSMELKDAYDAYSRNFAEIEKRQASVADAIAKVGTKDDIVLQSQRVFEGSPTGASALRHRRAEGRRDMAEALPGHLDAKSAIIEGQADSIGRGEYSLARGLGTSAAEAANKWLGIEDERVLNFIQRGFGGGLPVGDRANREGAQNRARGAQRSAQRSADLRGEEYSPAGPQRQSNGSDPQMSENNSLLQRIADALASPVTMPFQVFRQQTSNGTPERK